MLRHRLFFALFPPPTLARRIIHAMEPFADGARMMRSERLHITLDILDDFADYPGEVAERLAAAGAAVSAPPFDVTLDHVSGGAHTVALRPRLKNAPLEALRKTIVMARERAGIAGRRGYDFSPHLTLAYRRDRPISQPVAPVRWRAGEFVLIHSLIGQTEHRVIGRWPLVGAPVVGAPVVGDTRQLALF